MSILYPAIFLSVFIIVLGLICVLFMGLLNPVWWKYRWVKYFTFSIPAAGVLSIFVWSYGAFSELGFLILPGTIITAIAVVFEFALLLSLPLSGVVHVLTWIGDKFKKNRPNEQTADVDQDRRYFLKTAAAAFPLIAVSAGSSGIAQSYQDTKIPEIELHYQDLPETLDGLKILQISDVHLGYFVFLSALESIAENASKIRPDIVVLTGDIADNVEILPDALKIILEIKPKYGTYGSLGNHEYYRGVEHSYKGYENAHIPLLVDNGCRVPVNGNSIYIAGVNDPRWMRNINPDYYKTAIENSLANAGSEDFRLLLSHRPDGFEPASGMGIDLTLSGHTHGGQIGFGGRSVFGPFVSYKYLWGQYQIGDSLLYTTAGVGHWLPFRLGCPSEAPLFILKSNSQYNLQ